MFSVWFWRILLQLHLFELLRVSSLSISFHSLENSNASAYNLPVNSTVSFRRPSGNEFESFLACTSHFMIQSEAILQLCENMFLGVREIVLHDHLKVPIEAVEQLSTISWLIKWIGRVRIARCCLPSTYTSSEWIIFFIIIDDAEEVIIDVNDRERKEILKHVIRVLGKPE